MRIRYVPIGLALLVSCAVSAGDDSPQNVPDETAMKEQIVFELSGTGALTPDYVKNVFGDSRLVLDPSVIPKKAVPNEDPYVDPKFALLRPESVERGRVFYEANHDTFEKARKQYGVDPVVIASIFRLETNFGNFRGKRSVLNSLYSMYVLMPRRRIWAFGEMQSFLIICSREGWDTYSVFGSTAGAFGMPQFEPSSYLQFAVDGDGDGCIDLWDSADAVMSTAHYLRANGWGKTYAARYRAVYAYNHSKAYVHAVFLYAKALKRAQQEHRS